MPSTFEIMYGGFEGHRMIERTGLPIYDSFPEFEVDNWSEATRAKGKTKRKNVYLYDSRKQGNGGMYSDRMWQWDSDKMETAVKHLSRGWHSPASEISAMLNAYVGHTVELTQLIMMEDGRGYELFYIAFYDKNQPAPVRKKRSAPTIKEEGETS
jgi:hypothetical protein